MDIVRYGSVTTKTNFVDYNNTHTITTVTERFAISDFKEALAHILKHVKRAESGEISNVSVKIIEKEGLPCFIDLSSDTISTIQNRS